MNMTKLEYRFTNDTLFKIIFVKYPELLKQLVSKLLAISYEGIQEFVITNPEIPPESYGEKHCYLDINMIVDGQLVDLEIQVNHENAYPERSLYYWARDYSTALGEGVIYSRLPRTVIISILDFKLFDCDEFHSEFEALEVTRHTRLTDRFSLHFYELPKLKGIPENLTVNKELELWLKLFDAKTEEELKQLQDKGVPIMDQAIQAYRSITATEEFRELERLRSRARNDEASALDYVRREGILEGQLEGQREERLRWEPVVAEKDAEIERLRALLDNNK